MTQRIEYGGKTYTVYPDGTVDVYIPQGEQRVMKKTVVAHWRRLSGNSNVAKNVRALAK